MKPEIGGGIKRELVLYSLYTRRSLDVVHYDVILDCSKGIILKYLGEHWDEVRPKTGLPKKQDLLIYKLTKNRSREKEYITQKDIVIPICSIRAVKFYKQKIGKTHNVLRVEIVKNDNEAVALYAPYHILELVKKFSKTVQKCIIKNCYRAVMRA